jgi:hypothetical protein
LTCFWKENRERERVSGKIRALEAVAPNTKFTSTSNLLLADA